MCELTGRPGHEYQNGAGCTENHQSATGEGQCVYEDALFESRVHRIIKDNKAAALSGAKPLFIFWAPRERPTNCCCPAIALTCSRYILVVPPPQQSSRVDVNRQSFTFLLLSDAAWYANVCV